jgi:serine phosphatase RsbU (regulator of sigma subunit)
MDRTFASFAGWIVARQAAFLIAVTAIVLVMAWWIYTRSREMAIDQASRQQMMLTAQTARGIETYYQTIVETLDLLRRNSADDQPGGDLPTTKPAIAAAPATAEPAGPAITNPTVGPIARQLLMTIFWEQLRDRVSQLFLLDRATMQVVANFSDAGTADISRIVESKSAWLLGVEKPDISKAGELDGRFGNLVAVPMPGTRRVICAVVPVRKIEAQFFAAIRNESTTGVLLMDESGRVMSFNDESLIGKSMLAELQDPYLVELLTSTLSRGEATTTVVPADSRPAGNREQAGLVSVQPVSMPDGRWWLAISSPLGDVESVIRVMFRRILLFAGVSIAVFTFAFSRIAISQIRAKSREERMRAELLHKEVSEARRIQLAWLPDDSTKMDCIDICAVNKAANHISGDFYNWFELPNGRACVLIGDVTGHGMSAAFLMATTQMLLRAVMLRLQDPGQAVTVVNRELAQQPQNGQFVTLLVLTIDRQTGQLQLASAGHPPPAIVRSGRVEFLTVQPQLVAGIDANWVYPTETHHLTGDVGLLLYTDGIPDAPSADGQRFDDAGLLGALAPVQDSAEKVVEQMLTRIDEFRGGRELSDDVTMVAARFSAPVAETFAAAELSTK